MFLDGKGKEFMKKYFVGKALVTFKTEQSNSIFSSLLILFEILEF